MKPKELFDRAMHLWQSFDETTVLTKLNLANSGAIEDFLNTNGCRYYQWSSCLIDLVKPKQVVELGGAMGVWTICALHSLPQKSHLYSITLPENGLEFCYIPDEYPNLTKIVGDDRDMNNWKGVDLKKTDLWFFDTGIADFHDANLLSEELKLYEPYFKKGAIILFDDIHKTPEMTATWNEITWPKLDCSDPLHHSGFGMAIYEKTNNNSRN